MKAENGEPITPRQRWAYRRDARDPVTCVDVLRLGSARPARVRVRFVEDDYEGREDWVPPNRLKVRCDGTSPARLIPEVRELVLEHIAATDGTLDARLFTGPRGGRVTTAVLRDATGWDDVVTKLGYEHLRRHDLRHTGLTWMADAGVPVHHLRKIAGHASLNTTHSATCTPTGNPLPTPARCCPRASVGPQMVPGQERRMRMTRTALDHEKAR